MVGTGFDHGLCFWWPEDVTCDLRGGSFINVTARVTSWGWRPLWGPGVSRGAGGAGCSPRLAWLPPSQGGASGQGWGLKSGHERKAREWPAQLMWGFSITIITNHLITDFPTNSN